MALSMADVSVGGQVLFGRGYGEKTLGEVVKINPKRVKVRALEARGNGRAGQAGALWNVPYSLLYPVDGKGKPAAIPPVKPLVVVTPEAEAFWKAAQTVMENLWSRWQDEKEYEDIKDYAKPLDPIARKTGVAILGMTKSPFGVKYMVAGKTYHATMTGRSYKYVRVK